MAWFGTHTNVEGGVDDLTTLSELDEDIILANLEVRFKNGIFYTYVGTILVSINPYKLTNAYGVDVARQYYDQPLGSLPPHLFAIGNDAFCRMRDSGRNQVIVISGESGAGKTESFKLLTRFLAATNLGDDRLIKEQILDATPLLESFGNAQTLSNDNSSRFGKYVEIYFNKGEIFGAKTTDYLLEKSRVVGQAPGERNYHIFYELLAGLEPTKLAKLGLRQNRTYTYLRQGGSGNPRGRRDESDNFEQVLLAMDSLDFTARERDTIIHILAAILHLKQFREKFQWVWKRHRNEKQTDSERFSIV